MLKSSGTLAAESPENITSGAVATVTEENEEDATSAASRGSIVIPLLAAHPARHEVQGAVLHVLNEEG